MIPEPKIDAGTGLSYYDHLPEGFRRATRADLQAGYFKHKAPYLLQSFHNGNFYPRRVNICPLSTSPSPRAGLPTRIPSSA